MRHNEKDASRQTIEKTRIRIKTSRSYEYDDDGSSDTDCASTNRLFDNSNELRNQHLNGSKDLRIGESSVIIKRDNNTITIKYIEFGRRQKSRCSRGLYVLLNHSAPGEIALE